MRFDLLGQLFGKARRREMEGAVKVNFASIGKRLAVGAAAAGIALKAEPSLLQTKPGLLSLAGIGLIAMIPAGAAPAGLLTPAQPGSPSVGESVVQTAVNLATAPADKKAAADAAAQAQLVDLVAQAVINKTNMTGFAPGELGKAVAAGSPNAAQTIWDASTPAKTTGSASGGVLDVQGAIVGVGQGAIQATGGNQ